MIIWQPELMHTSAANGILKILEEPPPQTFFILVSNSADRLLPTIISRTQIVTVPLLGDDELAGYLQQHNNTDPERAAKVAQLADGNINLAFRLLEKVEDNSTQWFTDWMRACFGRKYMTLGEPGRGISRPGQAEPAQPYFIWHEYDARVAAARIGGRHHKPHTRQ